jgi:hypothetical protein
MSLEQKIKDIVSKKAKADIVAEQMTLPISNIGSGDQKPVKQGDSKDAAIDELDKDNSGASASAPLKQMAPIAMVGDAKSVKTQAQESEVIEGETLE